MEKIHTCWEHFNCGETECPAFGKGVRPCWLISGTRCLQTTQGKFIHKLEMCIECEFFKLRMNPDVMRETCKTFSSQLEELRSTVAVEKGEAVSVDMEMAKGLSEVIEALKKISSGDPLVRIPETSPIELVGRLKKLVNETAENIGEIVDLSHEFAIGLAEHFDVLHRVTEGDHSARVKGTSSVELLESLKRVTNLMIDSVVGEIAARKEAVAHLKHSEERFRTFAEKAPIGISIMHPDNTFEYINPAFSELFGYTLEDVPDTDTWFEKAFPEDGQRREVISRWKRAISETISLGSHGRDIQQVHCKDDLEKIVSIHTVVLEDGRHFVTYADITDRAHAEAAIKESEEKYRTLIENIQDGVFIIQNERFLLVNRAFTQITGYDADKITGTRFRNIVHPEDLPMVEERYHRRMAGEDIEREYELRLLHRDGKSTPTVHMNVAIVQYLGGMATMGTLKDITEKKELEARLQRSQKMEAIGTLAGGVAHDLNNILTGLVGYPELILLDLHRDNPLRKPIETIKKTGEKAAAIVQDLLTLARRGVSVNEVLNLNRIILDYLRTPEFENLQTYHGEVQVVTRLASDLLPILGSGIHLSKTVMNLISNGAEAMPEGGQITISSQNRHIDTLFRGYEEIRAGDYVVLSVQDTGVGISPEEMDRIFEPFYTKKVMGRSGTGLGMAVVWGTLKDHNGYIDIESQRGSGTTFTLYFPAAQRHLIQDRTASAMDAYMGRGESVLVVDDVAVQREVASGMLKKLGYSVTVATSGEEAVECMRTQRFELVLLDMIMEPGMDGLDTYRRLIGIRPGQKAIIASGFSETRRVREAQRLGAGSYLKKPYLLSSLGRAVRSALDGNREQS